MRTVMRMVMRMMRMMMMIINIIIIIILMMKMSTMFCEDQDDQIDCHKIRFLLPIIPQEGCAYNVVEHQKKPRH